MNREDFPLIMGSANNMVDCCMGKDMGWKPKPEKLVYLDNAATMQKPRRVIRAVKDFYETCNANPLRGMYELSLEATRMVDETREVIAKFIGAREANEIIFTSGTTEGLNMVAGWCDKLSSDDEILVGWGEHHSNLLPWASVAGKTGAKLRLVECGGDGTIDKNDFVNKLTPNTKVVAVGLVGNVFGGVNDVKTLFNEACKMGDALCVVDAAQAVAHEKIDVIDLGADVLAFSGHKIGAPMGIGALYVRKERLEKFEPVRLGGGMVERVEVREGGVYTEYVDSPQRFEGGTLNVGGIVGLRAAIEYLEDVGISKIERHEQKMLDYATERLSGVAEIYGAGKGMIAFNVQGVHPHDTAAILSEEGIAVRAGWHCAQPLLEHLEIGPVVRVSLSFYNTEEEIDELVRVLKEVPKRMGIKAAKDGKGRK